MGSHEVLAGIHMEVDCSYHIVLEGHYHDSRHGRTTCRILVDHRTVLGRSRDCLSDNHCHHDRRGIDYRAADESLDFVGMMMGLGLMKMASYYWMNRRKDVATSILN